MLRSVLNSDEIGRAPPPLPKRSKLGRQTGLDLHDARGGHRKVLGVDFPPVHHLQVVWTEVEVLLRTIQKQHLDLRVLPCAPKKLDSLVARPRQPLLERHIIHALFLCSTVAIRSVRTEHSRDATAGRVQSTVLSAGGDRAGHAHLLLL